MFRIASGAVARRRRDELLHVGELRRIGQPPPPARRQRDLGHARGAEVKPNERPHRGEAAGDGRRGEPAAGRGRARPCTRRAPARRHRRARGRCAASQPREVGEVGGVGSPCRLGRGPGCRGTGRFVLRPPGRIRPLPAPASPMRSTFFFAVLLVAVGARCAARRRVSAASRRTAVGRRARPRSSATRSTSGSSATSADALPGWRIVANDRVGRSTPEGIDGARGRPARRSPPTSSSASARTTRRRRRRVSRRCRSRCRRSSGLTAASSGRRSGATGPERRLQRRPARRGRREPAPAARRMGRAWSRSTRLARGRRPARQRDRLSRAGPRGRGGGEVCAPAPDGERAMTPDRPARDRRRRPPSQRGRAARRRARQRRLGESRARHVERDERAARDRARAAVSRGSRSRRCATGSSPGTRSTPAWPTARAALDLVGPPFAPRRVLDGRRRLDRRSPGTRHAAGVLGLAPWIPERLSLDGLRGKRLDVLHGSLGPLPAGNPGGERGELEARLRPRARRSASAGTYTLIPRGLHGAAVRRRSGALVAPAAGARGSTAWRSASGRSRPRSGFRRRAGAGPAGSRSAAARSRRGRASRACGS